MVDLFTQIYINMNSDLNKSLCGTGCIVESAPA